MGLDVRAQQTYRHGYHQEQSARTSGAQKHRQHLLYEQLSAVPIEHYSSLAVFCIAIVCCLNQHTQRARHQGKTGKGLCQVHKIDLVR